MSKKLNWGILSTAKIALTQVIPAMKNAPLVNVAAIASRDGQKANKAAHDLGIPKVYSSYEALLADPDIDVIYNPLPNNLHVPYTMLALKAGKHVLCEKPLGLNADEAKQLIDAEAKYPKLKVMEAFMYRFHPQWKKAKELVDDGALGEVKTVQSFFSYYNVDAQNIRNKPAAGGGALMDIGCYCISFARYIFNREPQSTIGMIDFDPFLKTDRLTSGMLNFGHGITSTFTCSTQLEPYQRVNIFGDKGRLEIEIPVNAVADKPARMWLQNNRAVEELFVEPCNQYTLQCQEFSEAVLKDTTVPTSLTDGYYNMKVIDALFKSSRDKAWVAV